MTTNYQRSHHCGELREQQVGESVYLCGWLHRRRDHGGIIFVDLRDFGGLTQIVFDPSHSEELHKKAEELRQEWVLCVKGRVRPRGEGLTNPNLPTGSIEVLAEELELLSKAQTPPFEIDPRGRHKNEELRLRYRYLDLRQGEVAHRLRARDRLCQATRHFLAEQGFIELHTPILCKSTPEGARDYLVPARLHPGAFFALPQSPQLFKQLLMIGGMERYYQIAPCFRDEDLRADRQPEFYQIDLEMSFGHPQELQGLIETLFAKLLQVRRQPGEQQPARSLPLLFPRKSYQECLERYGTDKPDLRFGLELIDVGAILEKSSFAMAREALAKGGKAKAICVKGGAHSMSRKQIDQATKIVQEMGLGGLAWIKFEEVGMSAQEPIKVSGSIARFLDEKQLFALAKESGAKGGDLIFIGFAPAHPLLGAMDHLRRHLGQTLKLIDEEALAFCWVVDFPLFEREETTGRLQNTHHAFTAPHPEDLQLLDSDPTKVRALHYDLVLNGYELGSGSQRIHDHALQAKIFDLMQLSPEEIEGRFGFFIEALSYGTPPHLGIALGLERIVMLLTKTTNIRDVVAFPKTQSASDLMSQAPSLVDAMQLHELGLKVATSK